MTFTQRGASIAVSLALLATVATQIFYIAVVSPADSDLLRKIVWVSEMALFSLVVIAALPLVARSKAPIVWSAIAFAGIVNVIQVGMGLLEFGQAEQSDDPQLFQTVLNGAFFLYFHGKAMIGVAAIGIGLAAFKQSGGLAKALGVISMLTGLAAAGLNLLGMANGMEYVFQAGAAGTAATAFFALTVLLVSKGD